MLLCVPQLWSSQVYNNQQGQLEKFVVLHIAYTIVNKCHINCFILYVSGSDLVKQVPWRKIEDSCVSSRLAGESGQYCIEKAVSTCPPLVTLLWAVSTSLAICSKCHNTYIGSRWLMPRGGAFTTPYYFIAMHWISYEENVINMPLLQLHLSTTYFNENPLKKTFLTISLIK